MILRTSEDVALVGGSCCPLPSCEAPRKECQSISRTSHAEDDDYTDSIEAWELARSIWVNALNLEWADGLAAWLAEDPMREAEDYPTPPPAPRYPVDFPTPEPDVPAGYSDVSHLAAFPYKQPSGGLTDDLPTIYRTESVVRGEIIYDGEGWSYGSGSGTFPITGEYKNHGVYHMVVGGAYTASLSYQLNIHNPLEDPVCANSSGAGLVGGITGPWRGEVTYDDGDPETTCNETLMLVTVTGTSVSGSEPELIGCPGPFTYSPEVYSWNYTRERNDRDQLASGISKSDLIARAIAKIPDGWEDADGAECTSKRLVAWPTIGDGLDGDEWLECFDPAQPRIATAEVTVTKARYRIGIPDTEGYAGFDAAHAAWVAADPETRGAEPAQRSYFEAQWDEVFFPADTEIDPSLVAARSWIYDGTADFSEWFEIAIPAIPGETRIVNLMTKCYRSSRLGIKPTSHGEVYVL